MTNSNATVSQNAYKSPLISPRPPTTSSSSASPSSLSSFYDPDCPACFSRTGMTCHQPVFYKSDAKLPNCTCSFCHTFCPDRAFMELKKSFSGSKVWNKFSNKRLTKLITFSLNTSSINPCLLNCMQLNCDSVNYNKKSSSCELFQHPFGYYTGKVTSIFVGWDYWQLFYE
ncbi:hypothetical protein HELRODRAFT_178519 [Helobdella robusta]|uniref:Apple domain-containing protein n=1 Tax=Helobdella robusta TaxID=6412 RepID=T1FDA7_HELRO|nr:hypothetical protein HELRODRAFT_178519 [Helobdella robusta]ESN97070.1 hypothetical protein HELRODRAFT_178519 [Helobdella robusta]